MTIGIEHVGNRTYTEEKQRQGKEQIGANNHQHAPYTLSEDIVETLPALAQEGLDDNQDALKKTVAGECPPCPMPHTDADKRHQQRHIDAPAMP